MSLDSLWTALGLLVPFGIGMFVAWYYYVKRGYKSIFLQEYRQIMNEEYKDEYEYRGKIELPINQMNFEPELSDSLFSVCENLHFLKKNDQGEIEVPEGFDIAHRMTTKNILGIEKMVLAYTFISEEKDRMIIVFPGASHVENFDYSFKVAQVSVDNLENTDSECLAHGGMVSLYNAIKPWVRSKIDECELKEIYITGHSMGAALSTLCAIDLAKLHPIHYSFGSPRVGNAQFARVFNEKVKRSFRIHNENDPITQFPLSSFQGTIYQHCGKSINSDINLRTLKKNHFEAYSINAAKMQKNLHDADDQILEDFRSETLKAEKALAREERLHKKSEKKRKRTLKKKKKEAATRKLEREARNAEKKAKKEAKKAEKEAKKAEKEAKKAEALVAKKASLERANRSSKKSKKSKKKSKKESKKIDSDSDSSLSESSESDIKDSDSEPTTDSDSDSDVKITIKDEECEEKSEEKSEEKTEEKSEV
jgi:triacylglycerol lipase